jgi:hypothetical protein
MTREGTNPEATNLPPALVARRSLGRTLDLGRSSCIGMSANVITSGAGVEACSTTADGGGIGEFGTGVV